MATITPTDHTLDSDMLFTTAEDSDLMLTEEDAVSISADVLDAFASRGITSGYVTVSYKEVN